MNAYYRKFISGDWRCQFEKVFFFHCGSGLDVTFSKTKITLLSTGSYQCQIRPNIAVLGLRRKKRTVSLHFISKLQCGIQIKMARIMLVTQFKTIPKPLLNLVSIRQVNCSWDSSFFVEVTSQLSWFPRMCSSFESVVLKYIFRFFLKNDLLSLQKIEAVAIKWYGIVESSDDELADYVCTYRQSVENLRPFFLSATITPWEE